MRGTAERLKEHGSGAPEWPKRALALGQRLDTDDSAVERWLATGMAGHWLETRPGWTDPDWFAEPLSPPLRGLVRLPLGADLVSALAALPGKGCDCEPDPANPATPFGAQYCLCRVVVAAAWAACGSWIEAQASGALLAAAGEQPVTVSGLPGVGKVVDPIREELALALRVSPTSMRNRLAAARAANAHPDLTSLAQEGMVSWWTTRLVLGEVANLDPEPAATVVAQVAEQVRARHRDGRRPDTSGEVRQRARRARLRLPIHVQDQARQTAHDARKVVVRDAGDGMADLIATVGAVEAHRIMLRLSAIAAGVAADDAEAGEEPRTRDQIRADVFTDLLLDPVDPTRATSSASDGASAGSNGDGGADQGDARDPLRPTPAHEVGVQVVVTLASLLGLAEDPGELPGVGPIPAGLARDLAADGAWRLLVTDATGTVTHVSARTYRPTVNVARQVRGREPVCRMPGCRRSSHRCDLDHTITYPRGKTTPDNLGPLCRRDHNQKTHGLWGLMNHGDDAGWDWTSPTGTTYHGEPEPPLGD